MINNIFFDTYLWIPLWIILCYLAGVAQLGDVISKLSGRNIRNVGTGNPGASNIFYEISPLAGITVFFLDLCKGLAVTLPLTLTDQPSWISSLSILTLMLGHQVRFPFRISGGTGMAAGMGAAIGVIPLGALIAIPPAATILFFTKRPSYTGVSAFIISVLADWVINTNLLNSSTILLLSAAILVKFKYQYRNI
ncbi:uncharacterized protein METZ01_LOCUS82592 [marine metagenome]|uniref:Glycerol-3-phosphate acyltransferase n=1 Tax=marine metagenome TaxID=408172 RepID=A0A381UQ17_9ZZZZ